MQTDERNLAPPSNSPGSSHGESSGRFQLSTKLTDKLRKLAPWRINSSFIEFQKAASEFRGGFATVSHALLSSSPSIGGGMGRLDSPRYDAMDSNGRKPNPNGHISKSEDDVDDSHEFQDGETRNDESSVKGEDVVEGKKQQSSGETAAWLKAVAVKKMKISGDPMRVLALTLREAEFLIELTHENIITLEGFIEDISKDIIWLVFPWEDNGTLRDFVASRDWEIPERISLINDVAAGVEYLHSRKPPVAHGDLKSINILVNLGCRAVITDFGSARRLTTGGDDKEEQQADKSPGAALSPEATFCGSTSTITLTGDQYTLRWAAPELLDEGQSSRRSDIWAFSWVAYEVMTNSIPFHNLREPTVIARVIRGDLPSISEDARILLIQALCSLMNKCWSIDSRKRPTAQECCLAIHWMPRIIPSSGTTEDTADSKGQSANLLMTLAHLHVQQGNYASASNFARSALAIYTDIADRIGQANALSELAQLHLLQGEYRVAVTLHSDALQIYTETGNDDKRAFALLGLGEVHRYQNEHNEAFKFYSEALRIDPGTGGRQRPLILLGLAWAHQSRKGYNEAITLYSEALQILTGFGDRHGRAAALHGLAAVHQLRNEYSEAITLYSETLHIRTEIGDKHGRASVLLTLAELHRAQNEYSEAATLYSEVLQVYTEIGTQHERASILFGLAEIRRAQNEYSDAITLYSEALQIRSDDEARQWEVHALLGLAKAYREQDDIRNAIHHYEKAAEISQRRGETDNQACALTGAADARRLLEQREGA